MRSSSMMLMVFFGCEKLQSEQMNSGPGNTSSVDSGEPIESEDELDSGESDSGESDSGESDSGESDQVVVCEEPRLELVASWNSDDLYGSSSEEWPFALGSCGWGLAVVDLDGDDDEDLLVAGIATPTRPLLNTDGELTPAESVRFDGGLLPAGNGLAVGDFNGDLKPDIVLLRSTGLPDLLFWNLGSGEFASVELAASMGESQHATPFDADGDGDLDLYVSRHLDMFDTDLVALEAGTLRGDSNQLYRNESGEFSAVSPGPVPDSASFQAVPIDPDGDGDLDLYLVNDFGPLLEPNALLKNDGYGQFSRDEDCGCDLEIFAMGASASDFNNDGNIDLHVSNIGSPRLLMGLGDGTFVDTTLASEAYIEPSEDRVTSWATKFIDLDQDGWDDLLTVFGPVILGIPGDWTDELNHPFVNDLDDSPAQLNAVLRNHEGIFSEESNRVGFDLRGASRSMVTGDFNDDGVPDVVVTSVEIDLTQTVRYYRGQDGCGPGITVRFPERGALDVGAKVEWSVRGVIRSRWYQPGTTYSSSGSTLHLGLGGYSHADWVRVTPFGGPVTEYADVASGTRLDQRSYQ